MHLHCVTMRHAKLCFEVMPGCLCLMSAVHTGLQTSPEVCIAVLHNCFLGTQNSAHPDRTTLMWSEHLCEVHPESNCTNYLVSWKQHLSDKAVDLTGELPVIR